MYMGGLSHRETWVAANFHWGEAHQRFCTRSQGVVAAVSVFVKLKQMQVKTRPSALGMSDPGVEPLEILEILELETPP